MYQPGHLFHTQKLLVVIKDEDGDVYIVAWLNDAVGRYSRKDMNWCIPESWQDEQGGYCTIDNVIGWMDCPK
jgi:hypothetical protein